MYLDADLQFCSAQALTGDAISENVIDLAPLGGSNAIRDIAAGKQIGVLFNVVTELDSAGDGTTMVITAESDSTADLATSATVHYTSASIAEATFAAGYNLFFWLPPDAYERYLGLRFNMSVENFTGGTVDAWLVTGRQAWRAYSDSSPMSA